jgi:hypothetical protein
MRPVTACVEETAQYSVIAANDENTFGSNLKSAPISWSFEDVGTPKAHPSTRQQMVELPVEHCR